jgi:ABC-type glycerol-3-phosphate transport system substrate-binding protein
MQIMKKFILIILIISLLITGLLACGNDSESSTPSNTSSTTNETTNETSKPEKVTKIVFAFPTWTGAPKDLAKVQDAIPYFSARRTWPFFGHTDHGKRQIKHG